MKYQRPNPRPLMRLALTVALVWLVLMIVGITTAHAATLQERAAQANDDCRDRAQACALRDTLMAELQRQNVCYNPRSATPTAQWVPCGTNKCARVGSVSGLVAAMRDTGAPVQDVTRIIQRDYLDVWGRDTAAVVSTIYAELALFPERVIRNSAEVTCLRKRGAL